MAILEGTLEDTGHLRKIAEESYEARNRPADVGAIAVTAALALAVALWAYPALDNDRFSIDGSRWVMAAASVLSAIVATASGLYILDRRHRKRAEFVMATLDGMRSVACHNAAAIGRLAAQLEQLDARLGRPPVLNMAPLPTQPQVADEVPAEVKDLAKRAFDTGRRVGRREADG